MFEEKTWKSCHLLFINHSERPLISLSIACLGITCDMRCSCHEKLVLQWPGNLAHLHMLARPCNISDPACSEWHATDGTLACCHALEGAVTGSNKVVRLYASKRASPCFRLFPAAKPVVSIMNLFPLCGPANDGRVGPFFCGRSARMKTCLLASGHVLLQSHRHERLERWRSFWGHGAWVCLFFFLKKAFFHCC